jgi:hypothetical protein
MDWPSFASINLEKSFAVNASLFVKKQAEKKTGNYTNSKLRVFQKNNRFTVKLASQIDHEYTRQKKEYNKNHEDHPGRPKFGKEKAIN